MLQNNLCQISIIIKDSSFWMNKPNVQKKSKKCFTEITSSYV